jgi:hypothetical protein
MQKFSVRRLHTFADATTLLMVIAFVLVLAAWLFAPFSARRSEKDA